jgi:predicted Ser/Thr protein kinase
MANCTLRLAWLAIPVKIRPIRHSQENHTYQLVNTWQPLQLIFLLVILVRHALQHGLPPGLWILSQRFILKTQNPDNDIRLFARESEIYGRLAPLQGRLIPRYYGIVKVRIGGKLYDAHLLEQLDGTPLTDYAQAHESLSTLEDKTFQAFEELSQAGIVHGDAETRNILVVDGDIKLIDFELAEVYDSKQDAQRQNQIDLETMFRKARQDELIFIKTL